LRGRVVKMSKAEFAKEEECTNPVFRLLDGWTHDSKLKGFPVLSILAPSQEISWKVSTVDDRCAPAPSIEECQVFSGISTRYAFNRRRPGHPDYPASVYGTIESRMKIVGTNLRLVFGEWTLRGLMMLVSEGEI
jgi:hypothetical protein